MTQPSVNDDAAGAGTGDGQRDYYNAYWTGEGGWKPTDPLDQELKAWLDGAIRPDTTVLDIGCGDGDRYGGYLLQRGITLHGVDVSDVAIAHAGALGIQAQTANLDHPLPYPDASFDGVICFEVLEHLLDPEFCAREILRVLRPEGVFLMSVPNVAAWRNRLELLLYGHFNPTGSPLTSRRYPWKDPHIRFFSNRAVKNMLTDVGFVVEQQGGLDTQFLNAMPGLRSLFALPAMRFTLPAVRWCGRTFYPLLSGRCVARARKPNISARS